MLSGFKQFILRGNVVDMAVGVVIGAAFGAVVTALVKDIINPIIALMVGKPDFTGISFTIGHDAVSDRRFHHGAGQLSADCGRGLLFCGDADQCADRADAEGSGAGGSDHQEVSGMPERDSDRCAAVQPLLAAGDGEGGLIHAGAACTPRPRESHASPWSFFSPAGVGS